MSPRLPARSAYSSDVRAYISRALVSKLGIAPDIADETARLWKDGRGAELCDFSVQAFKSVFGEQTGYSLFRIVYEDKLQDWKQSTVGMLSFYTLFSAIIVTVFLILRILVQYTSKAPALRSLKKDTLPLSQALFVLGLLMVNYGLQTPSFNGVSIAILGSMIGLPAMFAVYLCSLPEVNRGEEGQSNVLIGR